MRDRAWKIDGAFSHLALQHFVNQSLALDMALGISTIHLSSCIEKVLPHPQRHSSRHPDINARPRGTHIPVLAPPDVLSDLVLGDKLALMVDQRLREA